MEILLPPNTSNTDLMAQCTETLFPLNISNTDLNLISQCEGKWFRERCQWLGKEHPRFDINLTAGAAFAKGVEIARKKFYNEGVVEEKAVSLAYNYVVDFLEEQEELDELKSPARMGNALLHYFTEYPLENPDIEPAKLPGDTEFCIEKEFKIELPFKHPELKVPITFSGRLDFLGKRLNRLCIVDEKTCKVISSREGEMLQASGQFIGYAWIARELGVDISSFIIRKIAIQKTKLQFEELAEVPITEHAINLWHNSMLSKIARMLASYKMYKESNKPFTDFFALDYNLGCTAYYRPCQYIEGCISKYGGKSIETDFVQLCGKSGERKTIPLKEYKRSLDI